MPGFVPWQKTPGAAAPVLSFMGRCRVLSIASGRDGRGKENNMKEFRNDYEARKFFAAHCAGKYLVLHYKERTYFDRYGYGRHGVSYKRTYYANGISRCGADEFENSDWYELFKVGPLGGIVRLGRRVNQITSPDVRILETGHPEAMSCYKTYCDEDESVKIVLDMPYILAAMENIPYEFTDEAYEERQKEKERRKEEEKRKFEEREREAREQREREAREQREREQRERFERNRRERERRERQEQIMQKARWNEYKRNRSSSNLTQNMGEILKKAGII